MRPTRRPHRRGGARRDRRDDVDDLGRSRSRSSPTRARTPGVWLHVDAAYAGSAWVCPELRWSQAGVERADSLVVNAHKWLFTPMDCSLLWTRTPGGAAGGVQPRARVPAHERRGREPLRLRPGARPPLPLAQALGGPALLRPRGAAGADPRGDPARRAASKAGCATSPAGRSVRRAASLSSAFGARGPTRTNEALARAGQRDAASSSSRTRG